jgi:hypothetical protein
MVAERDAGDFLLGLDAGLVDHLGRGVYRAPRSRVGEQFFWSGKKNISPRPVTLWIGPIITVAVLYRLYNEWGWPRHLLGTQSRRWEFDVTAYLASDLNNEYLACEVKKTATELDHLVELMQRFARHDVPDDVNRSPRETNALRKLRGLQARRACIFWAVGPNSINKVFRVTYAEAGGLALEPAAEEALRYPGG